MSKRFQPNWVSPPGDTILDMLEQKKMTEDEFVSAISSRTKSYKVEKIKGLLTGESKISQQVAKALAEVIGGTPGFWLNRDRHYRTDKKRLGL